MADTLLQLARALTASQATSIAASLEIDGRLDRAASFLPNSSHSAVGFLAKAFSLLGDPALLASVLRGFAAAAERAPSPPRPVWSGPSFSGDGDHTTAAVAHLIDEAKEDILASTYSASMGSPFVKALWRAIARGVSVTLVVEAAKMNDTTAKLQAVLEGACFLAYVPPEGQYGVQHSKVVIVDSTLALVTSANLSAAAANLNLEAGVLIQDPGFASKIRQRYKALEGIGRLQRVPKA
ncbi:DISARM system phospholipase D-like protein DrmC [Arthrobacter silvisoli]|uniref:DISARM system phospholipase D-like protein DrmC n=1 Tax=Arthrobacter silvisoli TaxID=2291022 RepID=UPI000E2106E3|nr:DISARM system phospholipase D-like protein DrmC [Arthrobacter silvisoli]